MQISPTFLGHLSHQVYLWCIQKPFTRTCWNDRDSIVCDSKSTKMPRGNSFHTYSSDAGMAPPRKLGQTTYYELKQVWLGSFPKSRLQNTLLLKMKTNLFIKHYLVKFATEVKRSIIVKFPLWLWLYFALLLTALFCLLSNLYLHSASNKCALSFQPLPFSLINFFQIK